MSERANYSELLFVKYEWEKFTPLQIAYLIVLHKNRIKTYTETSINRELSKYHPNLRVWSRIADSLRARGFIERGSINYDIIDATLKQSDEYGMIEHKDKLNNLFSYEYNIKCLQKNKKIFDIIISKDSYDEEDFTNIKNISNKYNKELYEIDNSVKYISMNEYLIKELILSLRKDTWYRVN